jgi:hypothetical protein
MVVYVGHWGSSQALVGRMRSVSVGRVAVLLCCTSTGPPLADGEGVGRALKPNSTHADDRAPGPARRFALSSRCLTKRYWSPSDAERKSFPLSRTEQQLGTGHIFTIAYGDQVQRNFRDFHAPSVCATVAALSPRLVCRLTLVHRSRPPTLTNFTCDLVDQVDRFLLLKSHLAKVIKGKVMAINLGFVFHE